MLPSRIQRELNRIHQENEHLERLEKELFREQAHAFQCKWAEDQTGANTARIQKRHRLQMAQELKRADTQLMMVRRVALQHLLQQEKLQYQEELHQLGKSFHNHRL